MILPLHISKSRYNIVSPQRTYFYINKERFTPYPINVRASVNLPVFAFPKINTYIIYLIVLLPNRLDSYKQNLPLEQYEHYMDSLYLFLVVTI